MNLTAHIRYAPRALPLTRVAAAGALLLFAVLVASEILRLLDFTDTTPRVLRAAFVLFTVLAAGTAIIEHYMAATSELQRLNTELERRIAEKSEEIRSTYARVEEAKREWAQVSERQRILADLHDGVGASLVGLLRHVQSGSADRASIERRVQEVLQEMRIAIDALQPRDGDLAAVLGALRYRLDDIIRSSGVRLAWDVEELPEVSDLKPSTVFALQRIVLEAITNALKHSGAQRLRLSARAVYGEVEIRIEDNGRGFDPSHAAAGLGLANMRARARRIGARLDIHAHSGAGTVVRLSIPRLPLPPPVHHPEPSPRQPRQ
ncbi:MAG TPA: ATP-binding protein [Burkholderiales bacterium]|nr:ATP-binding protein [Burkholderiales bacterium]